MLDLSALILAYLCINFILIIALGYLQTPNTPNTPNTPPIPMHTTHSQTQQSTELCGELALAALCLQAFVSIAAFSGTQYFPISALFLAFTILCHHATIHRNSSFEGETCSCAPFQLKDVCNHETWVVASLVATLTSWLHF